MITITPNTLGGVVKIGASKSLSHRYVIAASLANEVSTISNLLDATDIDATKNAINALGAKFSGSKIKGALGQLINDEIDCIESGSTLRFFIPIAMLQDKLVRFVGKPSLLSRPLHVYQEAFEPFNYYFKHVAKEYVEIKGPLRSGEYILKGDVSSQFITGLLFALPLCSGDSKIVLTTPLASKGYVELTLSVLDDFKIKIDKTDYGFYVYGNQSYHGGVFEVEGDYSNAAFFIVAALIGQKAIKITNLRESSLQGDKEILEIVKKMNGSYKFIDNDLIVYPSKTIATTIDLTNIPDLGPALMVLASLSDGVSEFQNILRLKIKESDRLAAMVAELGKMGVRIDVIGDKAFVYGQNSLGGNVVIDPHNDHRIAMALAIAAIRADNPVMINDSWVVNKSYPQFFADYIKLGGKINE